VEGLRAKVPDARIIVFAKGSGLAPGVLSATPPPSGAGSRGLTSRVSSSILNKTSCGVRPFVEIASRYAAPNL
jgi:hypothetical protein